VDRNLRRDLAICCCVVLATVVAYWRVGGLEAVRLGDKIDPAAGAPVQYGFSGPGLHWALVGFEGGRWQPLTRLSHLVDGVLFGSTEGTGAHVENVVLHLLNSILLFLLLVRMTAARWPSALVAALFAVHPLHVESVAWIGGRQDLLGTLFGLLAVAAYVRYVRQPGMARYVPVALLLLLGLLATPMLATLPALLLLLDVWPLQRLRTGKKQRPMRTADWRAGLARLAVEKAPLALLSLASLAMSGVAMSQGGSPITAGNIALVARLQNALLSYAAYLGKMFCPMDLAVFYPWTPSPKTAAVLGALLLLAAISAAVAWAARAGRYYPAVGWLWFLGTLLPVVGLVQLGDQAMADRYTYLSLVGLWLVVAWGAAELAAGWSAARNAAAVVAGILILGCMFLTQRQVAFWNNTETLLKHALQVSEENALAHNLLGAELCALDQSDDGIAHLKEAVRISPDFAPAELNLARAYDRLDDMHQAMAHYRSALRIDADSTPAHNRFGALLFKHGLYTDALEQWKEVVRLEPDSAVAHSNVAVILASQNRLPEAEEELRTALALDPTLDAAHNTLGVVLLKLGKPDEGKAQLQAVVDLNPDNTDVRGNLARVYVAQHDLVHAIAELEEIVRRQPDNAVAAGQLGMLLAQQGDLPGALQYIRQSLAAQPENLGLRTNLAVGLAQQGNWKEAIAECRKVLQRRADDVLMLNTAAWIIATSPDQSMRDPLEAVKLAERAANVTHHERADILDTLAAAYAAADRFAEAVATADRAQKLAGGAGNPLLAEEIRKRMSLYRTNTAYREDSLRPKIAK
jgi:tetratricopeptide (TPR) repeat protein